MKYRRNMFLGSFALALAFTLFYGGYSGTRAKHSEPAGSFGNPDMVYRGLVLYPSDILSADPKTVVKWMREARLNLLGIHSHPDSEGLDDLRAFLESRAGRVLQDECKRSDIMLEYESHVIQEILPRSLFGEHPDYFPEDGNGVRQRDHNMCFTSEGAYREIEKSIGELTRWMKPSTHRYFLWTDDGAGFCRCRNCRKYSESELALLYENRILSMLRKADPQATLAHLAYYNTLKAPSQVRPSEGIFLEFAPISRNYDNPLPEALLNELKGNLQVFPANTAHVLEYWLDASMFSHWDRDSLVKVPWSLSGCGRDIRMYTALGIRSVTSFATWTVNRGYFMKFGEDSTRRMMLEYGKALENPL